ncbi:MAG: hypothetical protein ACRC62_07070 [Microcoleus sp.]
MHCDKRRKKEEGRGKKEEGRGKVLHGFGHGYTDELLSVSQMLTKSARRNNADLVSFWVI